MKLTIFIPFFLLLLVGNTALSQNKTADGAINESEVALLDILSKDTIHPLQIKLDGNIFKFGLNPLSNSTISLLKNKKEIYIQPLGTGKLFLVQKNQIAGEKIPTN